MVDQVEDGEDQVGNQKKEEPEVIRRIEPDMILETLWLFTHV
jgi:hypothetical protein